jgi:hypothetical protein
MKLLSERKKAPHSKPKRLATFESAIAWIRRVKGEIGYAPTNEYVFPYVWRATIPGTTLQSEACSFLVCVNDLRRHYVDLNKLAKP